MTKTEEALEKLKNIGYTDTKIQELLELLFPEVADQLFTDLASVCDDAEIDVFAEKLKEAGSHGQYEAITKEMAQKAYGDNAAEEIDKVISELLNDMAEMTLKIRTTYHKYMEKDPETVKMIDDPQNQAEAKKLKEEMDAAGFDFLKAASE